MKMFFFVFLTTLFSGLFLPWWWAFLPLILLGGLWLGKSVAQTASAAFFGAGLSWLVAALFLEWASHGLITQRMTPLFGVRYGFLLFVIVFLMPAVLASGMGLAGYYLQKILVKKSLCETAQTHSA